MKCYDCESINNFNCANLRTCPYDIRRCMTVSLRKYLFMSSNFVDELCGLSSLGGWARLFVCLCPVPLLSSHPESVFPGSRISFLLGQWALSLIKDRYCARWVDLAGYTAAPSPWERSIAGPHSLFPCLSWSCVDSQCHSSLPIPFWDTWGGSP